MMEVTINITKSAVMNEVAKQTSYIGMKITTADGTNGYDQVFTTNDDYAMLERYWREAATTTAANLKRFIKTISAMPSPSSVDVNEIFTVVLNMPARYDNTQTPAVQAALFSYFTNFITGKWLAVAYKSEAEYYEKYASESMREILLKIYYKKPTQRPA